MVTLSSSPLYLIIFDRNHSMSFKNIIRISLVLSNVTKANLGWIWSENFCILGVISTCVICLSVSMIEMNVLYCILNCVKYNGCFFHLIFQLLLIRWYEIHILQAKQQVFRLVYNSNKTPNFSFQSQNLVWEPIDVQDSFIYFFIIEGQRTN